MEKKLLTFDDLYNFYNTKKKSMTFNSKNTGYSIAVQTNGKFELSDELSEGLLYGSVKAFHDLTNNNKSYIETDVLKEKMMSIKDRPVMADIIETEELDDNGITIKDFSGHTMYYDKDTDKMIYKELPVGHFVNPESIRIEYDQKYDRNFVCSDIVVYEEYTDACEILRRRKEVDCSVELVIRDMSWNNKDKVLVLNDFYVQGCTLLGKSVKPGMSGSKVKLKDFAEENNSIFYDNHELIETLERLNDTLSNFNIYKEDNSDKNYGKEEIKVENDEIIVEEAVAETDVTFESTEEVTETVTENESVETVDDTPEMVEDEACKNKKKCEEENFDEDSADDSDDSEGESEDEGIPPASEEEGEPIEEVTTDDEKKRFEKLFSLSHEDIRCSLYNLIQKYEESMNDVFWIVSVYEDYFVCQGMLGNFYGHKYNKDGDNVSLTGEMYNLYAEFVTKDELDSLNEMRSNYDQLDNELKSYKEAEEYADKMSVFECEDYSSYLETNEFKTLMEKENVMKYSKEELSEKADAALGKVVRMNKTFSANSKSEKKVSMFAFAKSDNECSFLDGLLKK